MKDLRYLNGPWQNDACMGYAIMTMQRASLDDETIQKVIEKMKQCFDDTTVDEAAAAFRKY